MAAYQLNAWGITTQKRSFVLVATSIASLLQWLNSEGIAMKSYVFAFALLSAVVVVAGTPALAQNGSLTRSFVSSAGSDSNPCTITQPCATFVHAYTAIGANGIIAALDPGKYGPIAIIGPVTINGNGWAAITATAASNGITIAAGSGNVTLTGLEIDGAGAAYNGIVFYSGGNLVVKNCVLKDFINGGGTPGTQGFGIWIAPASGTMTFTIVDTLVTNTAFAGIAYLPLSGSTTATGVIDHVVVTGKQGDGIAASMINTSGGSAAISISNSVLSNDTNAVFAWAPQGSIAMTLDNDEMSYNEVGVVSEAGSTIVLGRSTITNNSDYGIVNSGTIDTFLNNQIYANGNGNAVQGTALTNVSLK
jgi:hypothetical protein